MSATVWMVNAKTKQLSQERESGGDRSVSIVLNINPEIFLHNVAS